MVLSDLKKNSQIIQMIVFPLNREADWRDDLKNKLNNLKYGPIEIDCKDWFLSWKDIKQIALILEKRGFELVKIKSSISETIVSSSSLGYETKLVLNQKNSKDKAEDISKDIFPQNHSNLLFKQGTLRSGEQLEVEGDVLFFGDVNPGAKISANGNVMIWGRLRGIAHAGKAGNTQAKIIALELTALQLRIADVIARGPEEKPQQGLAEEALLRSGRIVIQPAKLNSYSIDKN